MSTLHTGVSPLDLLLPAYVLAPMTSLDAQVPTGTTPRRRLRWTSSLGAVFLAALAGCSVTADRSVSVQRTIDFEGPTSLDVRTRNGSVTIRTDPGATDIEVQASLRASGSTTEAARGRVDAMGVDIRTEPSGLVTITPSVPGSWKSGDAVSFEIVLPAVAMVNVETSNGSVTIDGTTSMSKIRTSNGRVRATDCSGGLDIDTSNGSVKVLGQEGPLTVSSSNGKLTVGFADGVSDPFDLHTSNGSIRIDVTSNWAGLISASTSNGRVTLRDASDSVDRRGRSADFELGVGGAMSKARSSNGSIEVKVHPVAQ